MVVLLTILIVFFGTIVYNYRTERPSEFGKLLERSLTSSVLYPGILLLIGAFDPDRLAQMDNPDLYLLVAGLALIYVAIWHGILPPKD